ncbi:496_t:CDS:2, partial [Dentiscutata erythropus]
MKSLQDLQAIHFTTQIFSSQNEVQEGVKDQVIVQDLGAGPCPATQAYREKITSQNDIVFVEKSYDPARPHKNLKNMSVWEGK